MALETGLAAGVVSLPCHGFADRGTAVVSELTKSLGHENPPRNDENGAGDREQNRESDDLIWELPESQVRLPACAVSNRSSRSLPLSTPSEQAEVVSR
jgi:hypothetical protein